VSANTNDKTGSPRVRAEYAEYRGAFDAWAQQVKRLQAIRASGTCSPFIQEAEIQAAIAEAAYRNVRDRLASDMVPPARARRAAK